MYSMCCDCPLRAVEQGHKGCLRRLHMEGVLITSQITEVAAAVGELAMLQYAHEVIGVDWGFETTWEAAYNGHLDCLEYAYENGCPWHHETTFDAAYYGRADIVRYAIEHGCPVHADTLRLAALGGHEDCLEYVLGVVPCTGSSGEEFAHLFVKQPVAKELDLFQYPNIRKLYESLRDPPLRVQHNLKVFRDQVRSIETLLIDETGLPEEVIRYDIVKFL